MSLFGAPVYTMCPLCNAGPAHNTHTVHEAHAMKLNMRNLVIFVLYIIKCYITTSLNMTVNGMCLRKELVSGNQNMSID